jgi:hypothetical protein
LQNYAKAESLATEAYFDNFEFVEIPLAAKDKKLTETIESLMREDFKRLITEIASLAEFNSHIENIHDQLKAAELLLTNS